MNRITKTIVIAATVVTGGIGLAQAQTARDGSTSPGGLVTESEGQLRSFYHRGYGPYAYRPLVASPYAYDSPYVYGDVYAADPGPYVAYSRPRFRRGWGAW